MSMEHRYLLFMRGCIWGIRAGPLRWALRVFFVDDEEFAGLCSRNWKETLHHTDFSRRLRSHCVFCNQWVSMHGPGAKQHIRCMHPKEYALQKEATARQTALGFTAASPRKYCGVSSEDPRVHLRRCHALFRASLSGLVIAQAGDGRRRYGTSGGSEGSRPLLRCQGGNAKRQGCGGASLGPERPPAQVVQARHTGGKNGLDAQTTELIKALTKLALKHEDFMAFFDVHQQGFLEPIRQAALQWQNQYTPRARSPPP